MNNYLIFSLVISSAFFVFNNRLYIKKQKRRVNELYNLVSRTEKTTIKSVISTLKILSKILKKDFVDYFNINKAKKVSKDIYEVSYSIEGNDYKMLIEKQKGPPIILNITDEKNTNVTEKVLPYMGPKYDWHCFDFNPPDFFKCETLTFELSDFSNEILKSTKKEN